MILPWLRRLSHKFLVWLLQLVAKSFGIPIPAAKLLRVSRQFLDYLNVRTSLGRKSTLTIPVGAIESGSLLFVRGFVNNELFQVIQTWILPFWVREGLDPTNRSYLPRGLSLLFINLAHRNWTAIGRPCGERTAIVDPRGLVTPVADAGWSLDIWLKIDGQIHSPSQLEKVQQEVSGNLPIVRTLCEFEGLMLELETFASATGDIEGPIVHRARVVNKSDNARSAMLLFALRPFNPEGVSVIHSLHYQPEGHWLINKRLGLIMTEKPDHIYVSCYESGDVTGAVLAGQEGTKIECEQGLANGACGYRLELGPGESRELHALVPLDSGKKKTARRADHLRAFSPQKARDETLATWHRALEKTMCVTLPDEKLQAAFEANKAYLLLFCHKRSITPGPAIYNQFWFRDAAYMLAALGRLGKHSEVARILHTYPRRQRASGHFFSQEGEWDSNGQAIWTLVDHYRLTNNKELLHRAYASMVKGVRWIEKQRGSTYQPGQPHSGLLPPGLSAEHLGPDDYFYWDDFWGAAGEREAAYAASALGKVKDAQEFEDAFHRFWVDIQCSLVQVEARLRRRAIPASPYRGLDSAMIASIAAYYPLRLLDINDQRLQDTLAALKEFLVDDIFFHTIAHSGYNSYLNMQLAQCYLAQHDLKKAWCIIKWLLEHAAPTWTWPEAINPVTFGGVMGDGHHGWAAAELVMLVRSILFREDGNKLVLAPGLREDWLPRPGEQPKVMCVAEAPSFFGTIKYTLTLEANQARLELHCDFITPPAQLEIRWPRELTQVRCDGQAIPVQRDTVTVPGDGRIVTLEFH